MRPAFNQVKETGFWQLVLHGEMASLSKGNLFRRLGVFVCFWCRLREYCRAFGSRWPSNPGPHAHCGEQLATQHLLASVHLSGLNPRRCRRGLTNRCASPSYGHFGILLYVRSAVLPQTPHEALVVSWQLNLEHRALTFLESPSAGVVLLDLLSSNHFGTFLHFCSGAFFAPFLP